MKGIVLIGNKTGADNITTSESDISSDSFSDSDNDALSTWNIRHDYHQDQLWKAW